MKKIIKLLLALAAFAIITASAACNKGGDSESSLSEATNNTVSPPVTAETRKGNEFKNVKVGDYIFFGEYEQDNDTSNGKEDIEWLVLDKQDNKALVISKYGLDCQQYNDIAYIDATWETCMLRRWLNEKFLNNAFSTEEQILIQSTTVTADKNPEYNTSPGDDTTDKLFLLSIMEVEKYLSTESARECWVTEYCFKHGVPSYGSPDNGASYWWLRSPGRGSHTAAGVMGGGYIDYEGSEVFLSNVVVRPAMWISLEP